jgi:hypothetical protein
VVARTGVRVRLGAVGMAALCVCAAWVAWGPVRETIAVASDPSTHAGYYAPVERFLARHASGPVRIEIPLTRSHWETALLAPRVSLARGWEKQLDVRHDSVLLANGLTAGRYRRWLAREAVFYVALPDVKLDPSSAQEGRLIRAGVPFLREVFRSAHWKIYAVAGATPIVSGPGRLLSLGHESFALLARSPGTFFVRIHFTRYWTLLEGRGCISRAREGFTAVRAHAPGRLVVRARFSLGRALGAQGGCR